MSRTTSGLFKYAAGDGDSPGRDLRRPGTALVGSTLAGIYAFAMTARREPHTSSGLLGTPEEEAAYWQAVRRYVLPRADRRSIGRYGELLSGRYRRLHRSCMR